MPDSPDAIDRPEIRRAAAGDIDSLVAFNVAMARETEDRPLPEDIVRAGVGAALDDPRHGFYVVAVEDGEIVGSLMITYEWSDWRNGTWWWIQSVYVLPEARGRGVYRALYAFVRERARDEENVRGFRLYVEKSNRAAQRVYEALGMHESSYLMYEVTE